VIDPIDGTKAFMTGRATFVTLIALLDGDRPVLGVIDQPITRRPLDRCRLAGKPLTMTVP
jgi:fructose-1,6-bisphosphatase/inositol monophosphatase family enzyme